MPAPTGDRGDPPSRLDRRKARTRRALVDAAKDLLVERGTTEVSIQEITDRADVGFGSFYNHFPTKTALFEVAVAEVLDDHGRMLDETTQGIPDAAEVFAVGVRTTVRLVDTQPATTEVVLQASLAYLGRDDGLAPRALRDLQRGIDEGRFTIGSARLGLVLTTGCLLATVRMRRDHPDYLAGSTPEDLVERILLMLGMAPDEARDVARRPLPAVSPSAGAPAS